MVVDFIFNSSIALAVVTSEILNQIRNFKMYMKGLCGMYLQELFSEKL